VTGTEPPCRAGCGCVNTFSSKEAEADLKRYRSHGVEGATKALVDAIKDEGIAGATLLDIGGGIGAIQLELLGNGLAKSDSVDATEAYVAVARAEADRRGYAERATHRFGTLNDLASEIEAADIVTLDKVICCDPNVDELLDMVSSKARRMVGLIYPRVTWWNKLASRLIAAWCWITRDSTRWHIHSEAELDRRLRAAGFVGRGIDRTLIWNVALYVRSSERSRETGAATG
jgi:hypothetical protein